MGTLIKPIYINGSVRRLSIIKSGNGIGPIGNHVNLQQLRTLMSFNLSMHFSVLVTTEFFKCIYLSVLSLEKMNIESVPDNIGDLFNLRYLGLRDTNIQVLPNSIEKLHNLQTLDLMNSKIKDTPGGIVNLKKLRHLFAEVVVDGTNGSFRNCTTGINLPKGIFYLKELQTIQAVESNGMVVKELGNLTQLRSLRILNVKENQSAELCRSLSRINSFSYLDINATNEDEFLDLENLKLPQIQKLDLWGRLKERMLDSDLFKICGENIQNLRLAWSQLHNNPLPSLSHCKNVSHLYLQRAYEGQQLTFQAGWFQNLKRLDLAQMSNLVQVEMEHGTMASLEEIVLCDLKQSVDVLKGIENIASLKWMGCKDMPAHVGWKVKGTYRLFHFI